MDQLLQDLKYGLRTLARSPGFTLVAVLSLALGIGANTAIFTLTDAVFLNPLPVQDSSRVLELFTVDHATVTTAANFDRTPVSFKNYLDFRDQNDVFSGLAAFVPAGVTLTGKGQPKPEPAMLVTANYFDVLGVKPVLGRAFLPGEDQKPAIRRNRFPASASSKASPRRKTSSAASAPPARNTSARICRSRGFGGSSFPRSPSWRRYPSPCCSSSAAGRYCQTASRSANSYRLPFILTCSSGP